MKSLRDFRGLTWLAVLLAFGGLGVGYKATAGAGYPILLGKYPNLFEISKACFSSDVIWVLSLPAVVLMQPLTVIGYELFGWMPMWLFVVVTFPAGFVGLTKALRYSDQ